MKPNTAVISGTGLYTPPYSISNEQLVAAFNQYVADYNVEHGAAIAAGKLAPLAPSSTEFIVKASGIKNRFVIDREGILDPKRMCPNLPERANEEPSIQCEMAVAAADEAMSAAGKQAGDIDAVIVACSNLQRPYPAVAVEVQAALGIEGFGYDMNVACSSATFGIQAAVNAIQSGSARAVLMVNPEICSGHLNFRDRDSHFIFGDACTAVIVESSASCTSKGAFEILGTKLRTIYSNNIRNNFGFLNRGDAASRDKNDKLFVQNGRKVFKEVVPAVSDHILHHLAELDISAAQVKRFWLHQANLSMNQLVCKRVLGRQATMDEAPIILDRYANTSSAGSVIAFHLHHSDLQSGDLGMICSFGAGYSVGDVVVKRC